MTTYEKNKEQIPELDNFKNSTNNFLADIYRKAQKYNLSDKQVAAANRAYDNMKQAGGKTPWEQNVEQWPDIQDLKDNINSILEMASSRSAEIMRDIVYKAGKYKLSDKQIGFLKKLYYEAKDVVEVDRDKIMRVLDYLERCSPMSNFAADLKYESIGDFMPRVTYEKLTSMTHKYRRCIFKRVFKQ